MKRPADGLDHAPSIPVLYQAPSFVIVNKPSGIIVHRGWASDPICAMKLVRNALGKRVNPVHRLDRATSGALLFTFDAETTRHFQHQFQTQAVQKTYLCLVRGVTPEAGLIDHPVPKKPKGERVPALTIYRRLGIVLNRYSLVQAEPKTGRLHQIRRHLKHINHPLIGDTRYGDGKENRRFREDFELFRLALHAQQLRVLDPDNDDSITVSAPLPDDLRIPLMAAGFSETLWSTRDQLPPTSTTI